MPRADDEQPNLRLRATLLEVVDNQLRDNDPPETRTTLDRLVASGLPEAEAKLHIARAVLTEMNTMLRDREHYSVERYVRNLDRLPGEVY